MIRLQNETLTAIIADKGAELQQLTNRLTGINYLWSGDANYWGKYSPVLFPIVGGLIDDTYYYNNQPYKLPRHGFARDKIFATEQISDTEVVFTLNDDDQTRLIYPFKFTLRLHYKLAQNQLICKYEVYNPGEMPLLFSIGAHPAFAIPLADGLNYSDYYIAFNETESLFRFKLSNGLIDDKEVALPLINGKLPLTAALFYEDAIVLKAMKSNQLTLASNKSSHGLHFNFSDFGFFGIWAAKDAPFVCLEPWCGIADAINHNQRLAEKEGINKLSSGQHFLRSWNVECF
jgi:galactose mutarotase-like enzyme